MNATEIIRELEDRNYFVIREPDESDPSSGQVIARRISRDGTISLLIGTPSKAGSFMPMRVQLTKPEQEMLGIDEKKAALSLEEHLKEMYT